MGKAGALPKEEKQQGMTGQKEKETHAIDSV